MQPYWKKSLKILFMGWLLFNNSLMIYLMLICQGNRKISQIVYVRPYFTHVPRHTEINPSSTDLLMLLPSLSRSPEAPVLVARSLPARSTKLNLLTFSPLVYTQHKTLTWLTSLCTSQWGCVCVCVTWDCRSLIVCERMTLKTACERLLSSFMLVAATVRDLFPSDIRDSMSWQ